MTPTPVIRSRAMAVQISNPERTQRLFTADEYERMIETGILGEDERVELIDGEIRAMSPIGSKHAACVKRLIALITEQLGRRAIVSAQDPVRLSATSEPQPDIALLRPRADFYADRLPEPTDIWLIVEVADTSVDYDRAVKLPLYAAAGIPEAWLVDLNAGAIEQHTRPLNGRYATVATLQRGEVVRAAAVDDFAAAVADILG